MRVIEIDLGTSVFTLNFNTIDLYTNTPFGCHAGGIGSVTSKHVYKERAFDPNRTTKTALQMYKDSGLYRKLMDKILAGAKHAFGGWDMGEQKSTWFNKSHWIISAPWKKPDHTLDSFYTPELMDLIAQFCDAEPEKYGHYSMTEVTRCGVHSDNAGFPATRTMVWIPPHAVVKEQPKVSTRVSGCYTPIGGEKPKVVEPPKPNVPVTRTRPMRKEFLAKQRPKYGPQPRGRWKKAA